MNHLVFLCCFGLLYVACTPKLERENVPVFAGMNLEQGCGDQVITANFQAFDTYGLDGWMIEIPFRPNTKSGAVFKYYESFPLDSLLPTMAVREIPYSLAFSLENPLLLATERLQIGKWLTDISGIILRTHAYPPRKLVFMGEFVRSEFAREKLRDFLIQLRSEFPAFEGEIVFADFPQHLGKKFDWETPDLIGIRHKGPPNKNYREYFRKTHQKLSRQLIDHQKEAIIVQSNLIGEDKLLLFQNQLRFWNDSVALQGIVLNTLYCRMSLTDSTSHFSLAEEPELQEYLKER